MKLLHTSDWHIGRTLYGKKRYQEFEQFLNWVLDVVTERHIDVLIVAGDIFDTNTPSNRAQELYYQFLYRISQTTCQHVVIVGGNHDSPTFLEAPKPLLETMNVHVVGAKSDLYEDDVLLLRDDAGQPMVIVVAVPYLRDKDIRAMDAGENIDDKNRKLISGLHQHYQNICEAAYQIHQSLPMSENVPIIGTGHLFAAGGKTLEDDGVRELYVGSLAQVGADMFPECLDYVALGHLHVPQKVSGADHIRYCGSPIPMGFGEARQQKEVIEVTFDGRTPSYDVVNVPSFQALVSTKGDREHILNALVEIESAHPKAWLEVIYTDDEPAYHLRDALDERLSTSGMELVRLKNPRVMQKVLNRQDNVESLDDLTPTDVFKKCLDMNDITPEDQAVLIEGYNRVLQSLQDNDKNAD